MTYEDWILAVAAEAQRLSGSALKLLLHLASASIQTGSTQVRLSDRELETQLDICRPALTDAKRSLATFIRIESRPGVPSVFNLPADWFPGQRVLFSPQVAKFPSHQWQEKLATGGQENKPALARFPSQSGQESWPGGQESEPPVANKSGQVASFSSHSGQETMPPPTQNQQDGGRPSIESNRLQDSLQVEVVTTIDRVLDAVEIPRGLAADAEMLRAHLQSFMQAYGDRRVGERPPKDEILAKCLAIAGVEELLLELADVSRSNGIRPANYIWFVAVFLKNRYGIPFSTFKLRTEQRRQRKQPGRAEPLPFPAELVQKAAGQVKSLR